MTSYTKVMSFKHSLSVLPFQQIWIKYLAPELVHCQLAFLSLRGCLVVCSLFLKSTWFLGKSKRCASRLCFVANNSRIMFKFNWRILLQTSYCDYTLCHSIGKKLAQRYPPNVKTIIVKLNLLTLALVEQPVKYIYYQY